MKSYADSRQKELHTHFPNDHYLNSFDHVQQILLWTTFYKRNLHRFAMHYMGLTLHLYQIIVLFLMNLNSTIVIVAARSAAKSFIIAIYACCKAILYPGSKILIASATKKQAKLIVTEKIKKELMHRSANLRREILYIKDNGNDTEVYFRNGSTITVVPASDNTRGYRATCLIYEEFRMIDKKIADSVLSPCLYIRQAAYLVVDEYSTLMEAPIEIYISSAWFRSHWMWKDLIVKQLDFQYKSNSSVCILAFDYSIVLRHNIKDRDFLRKEKKKLDPISWAMEYENLMINEHSDSYFTLDLLDKNQTLERAIYPRKNSDYLSRVKNKYSLPRQDGEVRILSCDIAMIEKDKNDNSVFTLIRLLPVPDEAAGTKFLRQVPYLEARQGGETSEQAIRIKQLYEDFDADYCVLDGRSSGINIYDALAKPLYDKDRDVEYKPWSCINNEGVAQRIRLDDALPVVYIINATDRLNSEIAVTMYTTLKSSNIKLLTSLNKAAETLGSIFPEYLSIEPDEQIFFEKPYIETMLLVKEMIELKYTVLPKTGVHIEERGGNRKDRYSSLSYGNYFASLLEKDLLSYENDDVYANMPFCVSSIRY